MFFKSLFNGRSLLAGLAMAVIGQAQPAQALELFDDIGLFEFSECGGCGSVLDEGCCSTGEGSDIEFGGWINYGYRGNSVPLPNAVNLNFNDNFPQFGSNQKQGFNQIWMYAEKVADGSCGLDWGFRFDAMYGLDADDTKAFGSSDAWDNWDADTPFASNQGIYGWAMPQAYLEVAHGDWSIKAGHFYTLIGYEVVTAPDNFFYSHAYTMFNNEPFTHTGVLGTYKASDNLTVYGGWTAGWDTGFDTFDNGSNFLGGFSAGLGEDVTFTYITTVGDFGWRGEGYNHSVVVDVTLTEDLNYVFQTDLLETNGAAGALGFGPGGDHGVAVNQYLFYTINDKLSAGLRGEVYRASGTAAVGAGNGPVTFYEVTAGLNIKPLLSTDCCGTVTGDNLIIRPELRHDWTADSTAFAGGSINYTTFACDVILKF